DFVADNVLADVDLNLAGGQGAAHIIADRGSDANDFVGARRDAGGGSGRRQKTTEPNSTPRQNNKHTPTPPSCERATMT
ncbi:MAG: hypothetical protein ACLPSW_23120, partial [Roseiarcus sp.]